MGAAKGIGLADMAVSSFIVENRWGVDRVDKDSWRVPISRTYYTATTPTMVLEVYRDDRADVWYLQRVRD